jgi:hypothetical protein
MYINLEIFAKTKLKPEDLFYLIVIKQVNKELLETIPLDVLGRLEELSLLTNIKGKKSDSEASKIRLSEKGKKFIKSVFTEPPAGDDEDILFDWLSEFYLKRHKEVGNPNRVKKLLAWFSNETGIRKNDLVKLFIDFLADGYVDEESRVLEFTLFYPKKFTTDKGKSIAYEAKPDIFDSWLYKHFEKNKERLIPTFETYEN